jgi:hypothetical protein
MFWSLCNFALRTYNKAKCFLWLRRGNEANEEMGHKIFVLNRLCGLVRSLAYLCFLQDVQDPESYAGGSVATGRATQARQDLG